MVRSVCITEKIPERIKDEILAKNNVNIITYKNVDECCDQIRKILSNRGKRMAIAESAYNTMRNAKKNSENLKRIVNALMDKKSEIDKYSKKMLEIYNQDGLIKAKIYETNQAEKIRKEGFEDSNEIQRKMI